MKTFMPKTIDDPFYRYKRTLIESSYVKKNGGSTIILHSNISLVAKDLDRSIEYLICYLKKNLKSSITKIDAGYQIKGTIENSKLDDIIEKCIVQEILCTKCNNPETFFDQDKKVCKSCGFSKPS